jgi:hypothetical protein
MTTAEQIIGVEIVIINRKREHDYTYTIETS